MKPTPTPATTIRTTLGRYDLRAEADLHAALLNIQVNPRLCAAFGQVDVAMIATVASELGRNIFKYGGGRGTLLVTWIDEPKRSGVEIEATDHGPGFSDKEAALRDHFSTGGTLGLGLPGAARIMDSLSIESETGRGAVVTAMKWVKTRGR